MKTLPNATCSNAYYNIYHYTGIRIHTLFSKLTNPLLNSKLHLANSYSATHYCLTYEPLIKPLLRCCEVITEY